MDQTSWRASSEATKAGDAAAAYVQDAANQAQNVAHVVAARVGGAADDIQEVGSNFKDAVDKSITEQPMATLAVAAAVGFVLGALWKA